MNPSAAKRYLDAAKELRDICDSATPKRGPVESELHLMIKRAGVALRELVACAERIDEEIWGKQHPKDTRPPQPKESPQVMEALDVYREYELAPAPAKCHQVFKIVNGAVIDLVGLVNVKRRILWDPPDDKPMARPDY